MAGPPLSVRAVGGDSAATGRTRAAQRGQTFSIQRAVSSGESSVDARLLVEVCVRLALLRRGADSDRVPVVERAVGPRDLTVFDPAVVSVRIRTHPDGPWARNGYADEGT